MLTLHVRGTGSSYNPTVYEVGPGKTFDPSLAPLTGSVTSATSNTLTSSAVSFAGTTGRYVTITSGRGAGQVRQIQSVPARRRQPPDPRLAELEQQPDAQHDEHVRHRPGPRHPGTPSTPRSASLRCRRPTGETDDPTLINLTNARG